MAVESLKITLIMYSLLTMWSIPSKSNITPFNNISSTHNKVKTLGVMTDEWYNRGILENYASKLKNAFFFFVSKCKVVGTEGVAAIVRECEQHARLLGNRTCDQESRPR